MSDDDRPMFVKVERVFRYDTCGSNAPEWFASCAIDDSPHFVASSTVDEATALANLVEHLLSSLYPKVIATPTDEEGTTS